MAEKVSLKGRLLRWLEINRVFIVVFLVLPMSFFFGLFMRLRGWLLRISSGGRQNHDLLVQEIQKKVRTWSSLHKAEKKLLCTARPNWQSLSTTFFRKDLCHQVAIPLYNILELNEDRLTLTAEPFVSVGQATEFLIPRGYTLAVCLEVAEATLGGLALGAGMTTYSHKVGLYQESVVSYDVVLGDGSLLHVTQDNQYSDLFYTLPWSHGSLGFLVALEVKLIRIKPFVKLEYIPLRGQENYCQQMRLLSGALHKDSPVPDYLEATVFSRDEAVLMVGNFADVPAYERHKINRVTSWHKPWFYKHTQEFLKRGRDYEYVPLQDYLLRHNRTIFWVVEDMIPFGNTFPFRWLLGWLLPLKIAFLKFTTTRGIRALTFAKQVFQDIVLPMNQLENQINKSEELFDIYPLLIYPCRIYDRGQHRGQLRPPRKDQMVPGANYGMFNDLGVYGVPRQIKEKKRFDAVEVMRRMESFTREVGGYHFLYADTSLTRGEFEEMFDLTAYEAVRRKYKAEGAFPHLFDKTKPEIDVVEVSKAYAEPL